MGWRRLSRAPGERARTLGTLSRAGRGGWSATQPQVLRRLLSFVQFGRGRDRLLRVACRLCALIPWPSNGVCLWLSVSMGPAVA